MRLAVCLNLVLALFASLAGAEPAPIAIAGEIRPDLSRVDRSAMQGFEHQSISHITFHHEGFAGADADLFRKASAARARQTISERVRNINHYHATGAGLGMFAYHYAVDKDGNIAKGRPIRFKPATRSTVAGTGRRADFAGHFAVVVLGDFNHERLTPDGRLALVRVMSEAQRAYRVPTQNILPHKHHASTSCPGEHILKKAGKISEMVLAYSVQSELRDRGCLAAGPDGKWGPKSRRALAKLRRSHPGVLASKRLSDQTLFGLLDAPQARCGRGE